jgi:aminoglycoside N3'-acetyltransferase
MSCAWARRATATVFDRAALSGQLHALGLRAGDTALVRVDFGKLGRLARPGDHTLVQSLLDVLGDSGTLLALTHSPTQWRFSRSRDYVFHPRTAPCITGRFASTVLHWPGAFRSSHPTCSMTAVGPRARDLLAGHDHRSACCAPVRQLIEADAWLVSLGCTQSSPGFSTVHFAYEELGMAGRSLLSGLLGCYHETAEGTRWFSQRDVSGCSMGFHKFYPLYRRAGALRVGVVGAGEAFAIRAGDAYAVDLAAVRADPRFSLCDDPRCLSCRGTRLFNLRDMPRYWLLHGARRALRRLVRRPG